MSEFLVKGGKFPKSAKKDENDNNSYYSYSSSNDLEATEKDLSVEVINKKVEEIRVQKSIKKPIVKLGEK